MLGLINPCFTHTVYLLIVSSLGGQFHFTRVRGDMPKIHLHFWVLVPTGVFIRGNLGSKMGLIRKQANNKLLWVGIHEPIEFQ